jgi:TonB family protein
MKLLNIAFLLISINSFAQQDSKNGTIKVKKVIVEKKDTLKKKIIYADSFDRVSVEYNILEFLDKSPEYPGGEEALKKFIISNIKYPEKVRKKITEGFCNTTFTINTDGKLSDIKIIKSISGCRECDMEALRLLNLMKPWNPGERDGKKIPLQVNLPIEFRL